MKVELLEELVKKVIVVQPSEQPTEKKWSWLNKPFTVTVLGGIGLTVIAAIISNMEYKIREEDRIKDVQIQTMNDFAQGAHSSINYLYEVWTIYDNCFGTKTCCPNHAVLFLYELVQT